MVKPAVYVDRRGVEQVLEPNRRRKRSIAQAMLHAVRKDHQVASPQAPRLALLSETDPAIAARDYMKARIRMRPDSKPPRGTKSRPAKDRRAHPDRLQAILLFVLRGPAQRASKPTAAGLDSPT